MSEFRGFAIKISFTNHKQGVITALTLFTLRHYATFTSCSALP
ncbi:MAG: hypothetical protein P8176_16300 [Gammaproteobacteria bacterium]